MKQIKNIIEVINKFEYIVKIGKALFAGFDTFNEELNKTVKNDEKEK